MWRQQQQQQPWDEMLMDYPQLRALKWEWSPFPTAGNGFGLARLCLILSLLSWGLSGSSQALNLNLSKILGDA